MAIAEGLVFNFEDEKAIRTDFLETFDYNGHPQFIEYKTNEFSCVCPFSGLPDFGTLIIHYIPSSKIVELKSLKYYIISYRNVGLYQEAVTNKLFEDLKQLLASTYLKITTIYNTRGGIDATCTLEHGKK